MYVIISYDVNSKRCDKIKKILRKYLFHIQNSVFEGELTNQTFIQLKEELNKCLNIEEDSIIYYMLPTYKVISKEAINTLNPTNIII